MNSDPDGPDVEICYVHAQAPGGTLDDRMIEILALKKQLFAQVVDRTHHTDTTKVHYTMGDLVYLLTGERDDSLDAREGDAMAALDREVAATEHARRTIYRHKRSGLDAADDGEQALTLKEYQALDDELDSLDEDAFTGEDGDDSGDPDDAVFDA